MRLPAAIGEAIHDPVMALIDKHGTRNMDFETREPVAVIPGTLGFWAEEEDVA